MPTRKPTDTLRLVAALALVSAACLVTALAPHGAAAQQPARTPTPQQPTPAPQSTRTANPQPPPPARDAPLTPQERRGKALYLRGESPSGHEIVAVIGELDVPSTTVTCGGCHGAKGEGKTEGGVTAGNLRWSELTKPYGHTHPTGRQHGAFDEASFARAVTGGVDPKGNALQVAMPRYKMAAEDMADLIAYLKRIETDHDPGLTDTTIGVGVLVPAKGALGETGQAIKAATAAYFEELNGQGGIYNRRIELKVAETGDTPAATAANLEQLVAGGQVFALANVFTAGADAEVAALARGDEIPLVGAITLTPHTTAPVNRYVFYLLPGVADQARALAAFAAQKLNDKAARVGVVSAGDSLSQAGAAAVEEQCKTVGWTAPARAALAAQAGAAAAGVAELKAKGVQAVFLFGAGAASAGFLAEAGKAGWFPQVYLLGAMTGGDILGAPAGFKDKIFLAFPSVPADITGEGERNFRALAQKYQLPQAHVAAQLSAAAAAQILVEALKRAGQDLSREKLIAALEGLYEYQTGLTPALTYGPNRRVGALGAHIVAVDVEKRQYAPTGVWASPER
ncbi:MAG TPA: ABC transporter substrate-binding protein [Pyrinomonadaceae bacterium]|jgi:ABC-type branched-subunit amino acid transport system substrate-binding protein